MVGRPQKKNPDGRESAPDSENYYATEEDVAKIKGQMHSARSSELRQRKLSHQNEGAYAADNSTFEQSVSVDLDEQKSLQSNREKTIYLKKQT